MRAWLFMSCARGVVSRWGGRAPGARRIKAWTGQSRRDLQLYERVEAAALHGLAGERETPPDLAAAAIDAGFSDQSHLGREVLRMKALSSPRWRCAAARGARILVRRQMRLRAVPKLAL